MPARDACSCPRPSFASFVQRVLSNHRPTRPITEAGGNARGSVRRDLRRAGEAGSCTDAVNGPSYDGCSQRHRSCRGGGCEPIRLGGGEQLPRLRGAVERAVVNPIRVLAASLAIAVTRRQRQAVVPPRRPINPGRAVGGLGLEADLLFASGTRTVASERTTASSHS